VSTLNTILILQIDSKDYHDVIKFGTELYVFIDIFIIFIAVFHVKQHLYTSRWMISGIILWNDW